MNEPIGAQTTGPFPRGHCPLDHCAGLRVFDLTRVLAGPTCAQMLADLGADVIKIERPGAGDDTRGFAPPYMPGTKESAYFVGVNRNKRSVTLDIAKPEGQAIALRLIAQMRHPGGELQGRRAGEIRPRLRAAAREVSAADLLLDHRLRPDRAVCAAARAMTSLIQAMGGVMSLTGEPDGLPQKVGVPVADLFAGLYGCIGILAALRHRDADGPGAADRYRHAGHARGVAGEPGDELSRHRREPGAARQPASQHRAVPGVPDGGRAHRAVGRQRSDLQAVLRGVRADASAGGCALRHQRGAGARTASW